MVLTQKMKNLFIRHKTLRSRTSIGLKETQIQMIIPSCILLKQAIERKEY